MSDPTTSVVDTRDVAPTAENAVPGHDRNGVMPPPVPDAEAAATVATTPVPDEAAAAATAVPETAASDGTTTNPEVPPAGPAGGAWSSPWARPPGEGGAGGSVFGSPAYTPPPAWDQSGYAPPPAIQLDPAEVNGAGHGTIPMEIVGDSALPARTVTAETSARHRRRPQLRTSVTILLFLVGLATGVVGLRVYQGTRPPPSAQVFPSLDRTSTEPVPAGAVAQELALNDVHGLAQLLDGDTLTAIQTQLKPLVSFESVTFVGAASLDHDTLAGYIVRGRDQDGTLGLVGLVIRLRDGQVVAQ